MTKIITSSCLALALLFGGAGFSWSADYQKGLTAAEKGDFATALQEWEPLAKQGNASAQIGLGVLYSNGRGVPQNYETALEWYRLAAEQGYSGAQFNLGNMYRKGNGVPQNYETALEWYRLAAEQGFAEAQVAIGSLYERGEGVLQNYATALQWYRLAAEQGFAGAEASLGYMYLEGNGVPQNYETALRWTRLAAEQGVAEAQSNLGYMYLEGNGVPQNYATALQWYRLAAEQGLAEAQSNLGYMYLSGKGVAQNYETASQWYRLAAEQGHERAKKALNFIRSEADAKQAIRDLSQPKLCAKSISASTGEWDVRDEWKPYTEEAKRRGLTCEDRKAEVRQQLAAAGAERDRKTKAKRQADLLALQTNPASVALAEEVALSLPFEMSLVPQMNDLMLCVQGKFRKNETLTAEISKRGIRCEKLLELIR